jgi:hypothetical protein
MRINLNSGHFLTHFASVATKVPSHSHHLKKVTVSPSFLECVYSCVSWKIVWWLVDAPHMRFWVFFNKTLDALERTKTQPAEVEV